MYLLSLQDADVVGADFLGQAVIPVSEVVGGKVLDTWVELTDTAGNVRYHQELDGDKRPSRVHITLQFVPVGAEVRDGVGLCRGVDRRSKDSRWGRSCACVALPQSAL